MIFGSGIVTICFILLGIGLIYFIVYVSHEIRKASKAENEINYVVNQINNAGLAVNIYRPFERGDSFGLIKILKGENTIKEIGFPFTRSKLDILKRVKQLLDEFFVKLVSSRD